MDLNGKLVVYVKEFHKQRELPSIIVIYVFSYHSFKVGLHDVADGVSC